jgi:hypothetical protein
VLNERSSIVVDELPTLCWFSGDWYLARAESPSAAGTHVAGRELELDRLSGAHHRVRPQMNASLFHTCYLGLYCSALAKWVVSIPLYPARSAIVRET